LSTPEEARQIASPPYRQQLAEAVARAILGGSEIASAAPASEVPIETKGHASPQ
jgi:hypothetical protein